MNNKYQTRILTLDDFDSIARVITSRDYFSSIRDRKQLLHAREFHLGHTYNLLDADVQAANIGKVFGSFRDGELVSVLVTLTSDCQPNYFVVRSHTLNGEPGGPEMLSSMLAACVRQYEQLGYYRFYTIYTAKKFAAYKRLWRTSAYLDGYVSYTEMIVGANEKVKQSEYWEKLYGRLLLPEASEIRAFVKPVGDVVNRL